MARILYSALVTSINGSIAGTTFQRNGYGHTVKKKPNIVNPNTPLQARPRGALQTLTGIWASLTNAQRTAWDAYATANPVPTRLNPNAYLSGHAQWIRINLLRLQAGLSVLNNIVSSAQSVLTYSGPQVTNLAGNVHFGDDSTDSLDVMTGLGYLSAPVKPSQLFDKSRTRFMVAYDLSAGGVDVIINSQYLQAFGKLCQTNDYVFTRNVYFNRNNGQVIYYPSVNQIVV